MKQKIPKIPTLDYSKTGQVRYVFRFLLMAGLAVSCN
jgi:hypothetical protein